MVCPAPSRPVSAAVWDRGRWSEFIVGSLKTKAIQAVEITMNIPDQAAERTEELRQLRMRLLQAIVKNEQRRRPEMRLACNITRSAGRIVLERRAVPALIENQLVAH
jgi:hypothetical protein